MKLRDLAPQFLRWERLTLTERDPAQENMFIVSRGDDGAPCHWSPEPYSDVFHHAEFADATGIQFRCPKCYAEKGNTIVGVHSIICWRPSVPQEIGPKPGRWEFQGSGYDDLTLVAGSSSILILGGCQAHFFIQQGEIR